MLFLECPLKKLFLLKPQKGFRRFTLTGIISRGSSSQLASTVLPVEKYTETPDFNIRPSITDKARTVTHVCNSGTLCTVVTTSSSHATDSLNAPFGSYVDYILDKVRNFKLQVLNIIIVTQKVINVEWMAGITS